MMKRSVFLSVVCLMLTAPTLFAQVSATIGLTGTVLDETTRRPVTVTLNILDESGKKVQSCRSNAAQGGYYYVTLQPGTKYRVQINHPDYFREEFMFATPNSAKYAEVTRDWLARPMVVGTKMHLPISPFEYKKSRMKSGAEELLQPLRDAMVMNPNVQFSIACYPDLSESKDANTKLTTDRANALRDFFVRGGVSPDRIHVIANSEIDPLNPIPLRKSAKGRRYVGVTYIILTKV